MPFSIPDDKIRNLLERSEKYKTKSFNFGVVIEKPGATGSLIKEFIPVLYFTERDIKELYNEHELNHKDNLTLDMWEYFKEL